MTKKSFDVYDYSYLIISFACFKTIAIFIILNPSIKLFVIKIGQDDPNKTYKPF